MKCRNQEMTFTLLELKLDNGAHLSTSTDEFRSPSCVSENSELRL